MLTIQQFLQESTTFLEANEVASPRLQAEWVIADSLRMKRMELYLDFERPLTEKEVSICQKALKRRAKGEPNAYIRGIVDFFDCTLVVDARVLIPRQETEILVGKIVEALEKLPSLEGKVLWDLCCGSGAIAIALKKRFPELKVIGSDLSRDALFLAKENGERNGVDVEWREGDLLGPFKGEKADFVVSNPPYISEEEYQGLDREVRAFEPKQALVAEQDGYAFYGRLAEELPEHLYPKAKVWLEMGYSQGKRLKEIFNLPLWKRLELGKDWAGHDRFFFLEIQ